MGKQAQCCAIAVSELKRSGGGRMGAAVGGAVAACGTRRRRCTSLVNLADHVANGLVIESRPTAVGENFQVVCTSLKTTDDYEGGVKFHSAIAAVKMAAAAAEAVQWRSRWRLRRRQRLRLR